MNLSITEAIVAAARAVKEWTNEHKVDKVAGKGLSTNDYTTAEKNKLEGIANNANNTTINNTVTSTSTTEALSAAQGKYLNDRISSIISNSGAVDLVEVTFYIDADDYSYIDASKTPAEVKLLIDSGKTVTANVVVKNYNNNTETLYRAGLGYVGNGSFAGGVLSYDDESGLYYYDQLKFYSRNGRWEYEYLDPALVTEEWLEENYPSQNDIVKVTFYLEDDYLSLAGATMTPEEVEAYINDGIPVTADVVVKDDKDRFYKNLIYIGNTTFVEGHLWHNNKEDTYGYTQLKFYAKDGQWVVEELEKTEDIAKVTFYLDSDDYSLAEATMTPDEVEAYINDGIPVNADVVIKNYISNKETFYKTLVYVGNTTFAEGHLWHNNKEDTYGYTQLKFYAKDGQWVKEELEKTEDIVKVTFHFHEDSELNTELLSASMTPEQVEEAVAEGKTVYADVIWEYDDADEPFYMGMLNYTGKSSFSGIKMTSNEHGYEYSYINIYVRKNGEWGVDTGETYIASEEQLSDVEAKIPTKTSQLENDSGYLTPEDIPDLPSGSDGKDGYSVYKCTREPWYESNYDWYELVPSDVETNGRELQAGDFILSPNGKVFVNTGAVNGLYIGLEFYANLKGDDGISPTVTTSKSGKVTTVTFTDKNGTKTATINDGADGASGKDGQDGADGQRGTGILSVVTMPQDYTTETNGKNPIKRMSLSTIINESGVDNVIVGDLVKYSYWAYHIYYIDDNYAYFDLSSNLRGASGSNGTSVTVTNVSESTADGGNNVVTFSDGTSLTVKNGSKGSTGANGVDGKSPIITMFISPEGSDSNNGLTAGTPKKTVKACVNAGATRISAKRGIYNEKVQLFNIGELEIFPTDNDLTYAVGTEREPIVFEMTDSIAVSSLATYNSIKRVAYSNSANTQFDKVFTKQSVAPVVGDGYGSRYNSTIWLLSNDEKTVCIKLKPVLTVAECEAETNTFTYVSGYIYINANMTGVEKIVVPTNWETGFYINGAEKFVLKEVEVRFSGTYNIDIRNCAFFDFYKCACKYTSYGSGFHPFNSNGKLTACYATKNYDGYGVSGYGHTTYIDCVSEFNFDDGVSHHDGTEGTFIGGRYEGNGKGGNTPAYGAKVNIYGGLYKNNASFGIGYLYTSDHNPASGMVQGAVMVDNPVGLSVDKNCDVIALNCHYDNNTTDKKFNGNVVEYNITDGYVKSVNGITPDENGNVVVEGGGGDTPAYTNVLPLAINADGTPYVGTNGEKGYKTGYRLNSSGNEAAQANCCVTGFIKAKQGDILRIKNFTTAVSGYNYLHFYKSDFTKYGTPLNSWADYISDGIITIDLAEAGATATTEYIRISLGVIDDTTIITVNEEITE